MSSSCSCRAEQVDTNHEQGRVIMGIGLTCGFVMLKLMTHMWRNVLEGKQGMARRVVANIWNLQISNVAVESVLKGGAGRVVANIWNLWARQQSCTCLSAVQLCPSFSLICAWRVALQHNSYQNPSI